MLVMACCGKDRLYILIRDVVSPSFGTRSSKKRKKLRAMKNKITKGMTNFKSCKLLVPSMLDLSQITSHYDNSSACLIDFQYTALMPQ